MARECSKAVRRRMGDSEFVARYFVGRGLDVGPGPDPLMLYMDVFPKIAGLDHFDRPQGDAQLLDGIADESYDFLHSSHCLEHLRDCFTGIRNWFRVIRPGGYLIVTVPDEDLYEQGQFPSTFNSDHKWTFTIYKRQSWCDRSVNLFNLILGLGETAEIKRLVQIETGYRYDIPRFDQTLTPFAESAIEFVVRKRSPQEISAGGRMPGPGQLSTIEAILLTGVKPD